MEWNNGKERAKFEMEQAKKRKEYLAAGMTEEQIKALYEFDLEWYRGRRREAKHTQRLDIEAFDDDGDDESKNPLYKKFLHCFSKEDKYFENDRYAWIEEIENEKLYEAVKSLTATDIEVLTCYLYDGLTQRDIAEKLEVNQSNISRRIIRLEKLLKNFL